MVDPAQNKAKRLGNPNPHIFTSVLFSYFIYGVSFLQLIFETEQFNIDVWVEIQFFL